jgi:hypothetical protein
MKTTTVLLLGALVVSAFLPTCMPDEECTEGATRCRGASAEVCDAGGRWAPFLACGELVADDGSPFACCAADPATGPDVICLPEAECEANRGR